MKSIPIKLSLVAYFFVSALVAVYIVVDQFSDQPSSASVINTSVPGTRDCDVDASTNPYAQAAIDCEKKSVTPTPPVISTTGDAAAVGKNLRKLAYCSDVNSRCMDATQNKPN